MKTIDVTLTVRDENGNVLSSYEYSRHTSFMAHRCRHAVWDDEQVKDETEEDGNLPTCGWCESQGVDGVLYPCEAVYCEICRELFEVGYFVEEHIGWCGT